jgi:hypothetical protein
MILSHITLLIAVRGSVLKTIRVVPEIFHTLCFIDCSVENTVKRLSNIDKRNSRPRRSCQLQETVPTFGRGLRKYTKSNRDIG